MKPGMEDVVPVKITAYEAKVLYDHYLRRVNDVTVSYGPPFGEHEVASWVRKYGDRLCELSEHLPDVEEEDFD